MLRNESAAVGDCTAGSDHSVSIGFSFAQEAVGSHTVKSRPPPSEIAVFYYLCAMPIMTGLSGNEMYCLNLKGYSPGELCIGNSVHSLGVIGGIGAGLQGMFGGEVTHVTEVINDGRRESLGRILKEAGQHQAQGVTSVTSELRRLRGNVEFVSIGSGVHGPAADVPNGIFSTSSNGQELYCMLDSGYAPRQFVFGNVAYSVGVVGGIFGALKTLARGEIKEFSDIFNQTRHLALRRIASEARAAGANAVVGIETRIVPFRGVHEMLMLGTAAHHPGLPASAMADPVTSDLTCEEMWNLAALGYAPQKLVLGTAVYSLGLVSGFKTMFQGLMRGEINDLTSLIYEAREHAIGMIRREAELIGADDVVGIKTHIHEIGTLIEFMAIGTAVKRIPNMGNATATLPAQAVIRDKDTWISSDNNLFGSALAGNAGGKGE